MHKRSGSKSFRAKDGGADRNRTCDLLIANGLHSCVFQGNLNDRIPVAKFVASFTTGDLYSLSNSFTIVLVMKVSVSPVTIRGESQWMISWTPAGGKRVRHYHPSKKSAEAEQASVIAQQKQAGSVWMSLPADERNT